MSQPTPAIVAQAAVRRLPRVALILLCAAYLMPGLVGRGPWKNADVAAFGYMAELARSTEGAARWFDPLLFGLRPESPALLPYWIGAWAIKLAPAWINPDLAVRFVFALLLWGTFTATWYAVYFLARTPRAQPVAFAFGGEAQPADYARAIADGALLALMATLGLLQLGHETTPALAQLFFTASLFYGIAALPYRPIGALAALVLGAVGMTLSGAPTLALILCAGCALFLLWDRKQSRSGDERDPQAEGNAYPLYALLAIIVVGVLAGSLATSYGLIRWHIVLPGTSASSSLSKDLRSQVKLLLWFPWPAWPLAGWTLWRWRRQLNARHVILPLWFVLVPLAATLTTDFSDRSLLLSLPAFATLAAFALPTFRRSVAALLDWLTLLTFTTCAIFIWLYWISLQTGIPPKPAANVARLAPGFVPSFSATAFVFALAATVAWFWLVRWRTGRHQAALWKTLVLPAGGTALCWMLVMTLWLPVLDYARSYAPQVQMISQRVGNTPCLSELGLQRPQLAALLHHGHFELRPLTGTNDCRWLLVNPEVIGRLQSLIDLNQWRFDGTLRRPSSDTDDLLLYQRIAP
ncbi:hypothetical protein WKW80_05540 [Variovorax humicola]|uniref:4-amino-4-deoxy-L-arabinose transferase-like glycosyltransferase n=1 Tax=Variovorax humicola TaxID=1769758 RepID=A0ABU8VUL2_9BURK